MVISCRSPVKRSSNCPLENLALLYLKNYPYMDRNCVTYTTPCHPDVTMSYNPYLWLLPISWGTFIIGEVNVNECPRFEYFLPVTAIAATSSYWDFYPLRMSATILPIIILLNIALNNFVVVIDNMFWEGFHDWNPSTCAS